VHGPALDLIVGCGAWSVPLLLLAGGGLLETRTWSVVFYLLALAVNYPHYMATVYRAYRTRTAFSRYRAYTLYGAILLTVVAGASHGWPALLPWVFTIYVTWSPWHYTAQNFGLTMMFARRNGVSPTPSERRRLHLAFIASYALIFISFHTGHSTDPLIRSLGIPVSVARPAAWALLVAIVALGPTTLWRWTTRAGLAATLPLVTLAVTQASWFVLPTLLGGLGAGQTLQTRYSTGALAIMHSAQYLWITSHFARREAESEGRGLWNPWAYAATLGAGGIALFVPWPWLISHVFRADFTESVLIVTAIINIHHFVLDGAIWKLRDRGIARLLIESRDQATDQVGRLTNAAGRATAWVTGSGRWSGAVRLCLLAGLCAWAGIDQLRFFWATSAASEPSLAKAAALTPDDSSIERRQGRLFVEQKRYAEAHTQFVRILRSHPDDGEALLSAGLLAAKLGRDDEAAGRWEAAVEVTSVAPVARQLLAQLWAARAERLAEINQPSQAAQAFLRALALDEANDDQAALGVDWFNYGEFLKHRSAPPELVAACLLRAEELLAERPDPRLETVRTAVAEIEQAAPSAIADVRKSPQAALDAARHWN
jgi:tetratricopeptide (TPR) repeat protein